VGLQPQGVLLILAAQVRNDAALAREMGFKAQGLERLQAGLCSLLRVA